MANDLILTQSLGFIKKGYQSVAAAQAASTGNGKGKIVFDTTNKIICVNGVAFGGNITDATFTNSVLTITKATGDPVVIDFSDIASASAMMKVFEDFAGLMGLDSHNGLDYRNTNYLENADSLRDADVILDEKLAEVEGNVDDLADDVADLADEVDEIKDVLGSMDGTATVATVENDIVTIKRQVKQENGEIVTDSADGIALAKVAKTGAAENVSFKDYTPEGLGSGEGISAENVQEAIEKVVDEIIKNEQTTEAAFEAIKNAAGLSENLEFSPDTSRTEIITPAEDITEALTLLDKAIQDLESGTVTDVQINGDSIVDNRVANIAIDGEYDEENNKIATEETVENAVETAIEGLDGDAIIATKVGNVITIKKRVVETDGEIDNESGSGSGVEIVLAEVAATGAAADVDVADTDNHFTADNVEGVLAEIALAVEALQGAFDVIVSHDAATTPYGVTWIDNTDPEHPQEVTGTLTASANTFHKIYLVPANGTNPNAYSEYITTRTNTGTEQSPVYVYDWEKLGDIAVDLTGYVRTITVNGKVYAVDTNTTNISLGNVITSVTGENATLNNSDFVSVKVTETTDSSTGADSIAISSTVKTVDVENATSGDGDGLATAKNVKDYVDTKSAVVNSNPTIKANDTTAAQIGTVGGTALTAKVALFWDEWESDSGNGN